MNIELAREVSSLQNETAQAVVMNEVFSHDNGELLLRNPAVFADRLNHVQFTELTPSAQGDLVTVARRVVAELPTAAADRMTERFSHETVEDYEYRVEVWSVLHGLQRAVSIGPNHEQGYTKSKEGLIGELILQSSTGFGVGLQDMVSKGHPALTRDLRHFYHNIPQRVLRSS
jgi:hypothetical protein